MAKSMTASAFRAWLQKHPRLQFLVGNPCHCPVARYLGDGSYVEGENYYPPGREKTGKKMLRLPVWACRFVHAFDELGAPEESYSGARALEVLLSSSYRRA